MKFLTFSASLLLLASMACLRPEPIPYRVSIGMSEAKLKAAVGEPMKVETSPDGATYRYEIWLYNWMGRPSAIQHWHVHLKEGVVDGYALDALDNRAKPARPATGASAARP